MYLNWMKHLLLTIDEEDGDKGAGGDGKEEKEESIDSAVDKAEKALNKDDKEDEEDEEDSEDKEEGSEEEEPEEEDLTEDQQKQAKNVFKLLSNPETAVEALRTLAAQAGLKLEKAESKEEKKEVKRAIKDIVKEKLGANYPHLADILGDTLQDLLTEAIKEGNKDIREKLDKDAHEKLKETISSAQTKVVSEFVDVPTKVLQEFVRMQEQGELLPGPKQSPEKFFRAGIKEAADNLKIALVKKQVSKEEVREKKSKSPLDELESKGRNSARSEKDGIKTTQVKNFNDAIKLGVEAVAKKMNKG